MPVDASIYGAIQPVRPANRLAELAQVIQVQGLQGQNELAQYTRRKAEREDAEANAINAAYRDAVGPDGAVDRNKLYQAVASGGFGARLPAIQKSFADADSAETTRRKSEFDLRKQTSEAVGQAFMGVLQNPTPENASQTIDLLGSRKYFTPQEVAEFKQIVATNPQAIGPLAERMVRLTASVKDQLPTFETRNLGGTTDTLRRDGLTGKVETVNTVQNTQSPDNKASVGASLANAAATRDVAAATRDAAKMNRTYESEQGLRKEFEALPEVKNYKTALPSFNGVKDAVTRNTTQSDINIVYGIAKLYDPTSVVREGEYATVANSPNIPERIKGYAQYLAGGGRLSPKVKADILAEATSRMKSYEDQYTAARTDFESIAQRSGVDPTRVFPSPAKPAAVTDPKGAGAPAGGGLSAEEQKELDALRARFGRGK